MDAGATVKVGVGLAPRMEAARLPWSTTLALWHPYPDHFCLRVPIGWADEQLGPPSYDYAIGEGPGHEKGWCLAFPCGLRCVLVLQPLASQGFELLHVLPDVMETAHLLRHLRAPAEWVVDADRRPEALGSWAVWRQDDNGHQLIAGYGASERDARCLADAFERRAHKQMYWVEKRDGIAGTAPVRRRE